MTEDKDKRTQQHWTVADPSQDAAQQPGAPTAPTSAANVPAQPVEGASWAQSQTPTQASSPTQVEEQSTHPPSQAPGHSSQAPGHSSQAPGHPGAPVAHPGQAPVAVAAPSPDESMHIETLSGRFLWISFRRAFRLQIRTKEVLSSERKAIEEEAGHIVDPEQQAFLAWRRSVLLMVAFFFVPLTVTRFIEAFKGPDLPAGARIFILLPAIAEAALCFIAFVQLKNWTQWKRQRRVLFIAFALYFLAPFLVYLYPFRSAFDDSVTMLRDAAALGGVRFKVSRSQLEMAVGLAFGVQAMMALGPKVISLMPGLIRASIVSKLLFPGTTAPGWLMMLAAPVYALFAYIIVLLPYQITGSWMFLGGNAGFMIAQIFIGLSGRKLTMPLSEEESYRRIHNAWIAYILIIIASAVMMIFGLTEFITELNLHWIRIVTGVLTFFANVLLLTLVGTDAIVAGMAHFRRKHQPDPNRESLLRYSEGKLDRFSS